MSRPTWDDYFLGLAKVVSTRSRDSQTQHGCVIVGKNHEILATGYNGFPRGMKDDSALPSTRPDKYPWMKHSEKNALASTRASKADLEESTLYVTGPCCFECLTDAWQFGIRRIVHVAGYGWSKDEQEESRKSEFMRQTNGQMTVVAVTPNLQWLVDLVLGNEELQKLAISGLRSCGKAVFETSPVSCPYPDGFKSDPPVPLYTLHAIPGVSTPFKSISHLVKCELCGDISGVPNDEHSCKNCGLVRQETGSSNYEANRTTVSQHLVGNPGISSPSTHSPHLVEPLPGFEDDVVITHTPWFGNGLRGVIPIGDDFLMPKAAEVQVFQPEPGDVR